MTESQVPPIESEWDDSLPSTRPGWPKVVGIISIVWGSLWILCGGCGTAFQIWGASLMPPDPAASTPPPSVGPLQVVSALIGIAIDVFLIVAGVMTVSRKPLGRQLHLIYAAIALPVFVLGMYAQMQQQALMQQWVQQNPDTQAAKWMSSGQGTAGTMIGWGCAAIAGLVYPLFLLVWFGIVKRGKDSMTGGVSAPEEPAA